VEARATAHAPHVDLVSPVEAAGGVVTRTNESGELEFLVVHRPRYDDWSLPKGKLEPGETVEQAALREVQEETGLRCALGERVGEPHHYRDRKGRPKVVHFFRMTPVETGTWTANDEVDELRWVISGDAATLLTYDADRQLVSDVAQ
jgi:8-oxo-dGTP diphosphatase